MHLSCRKVLAAILIWLASPVLAKAGGEVSVIDGRTVITVVVPSLPNASDVSPASRAAVEVVRKFETDFPKIFREKYLTKYQADPKRYGHFDWNNVTVRLVPFSGLKVEGVESDLMAIAGGNPPDVLYVNFRKSDTYIRSGFLYPLDKPEDGYFTELTDEQRNARIHSKVWPVIQRKGPNGEKHLWAMPTGGLLGRVLAYRKDLFDEAGIEYPTADWTWRDLSEAAKALTNPSAKRTGLLLVGDAGWEFSTFLWSAGGDVMEYAESDDSWRCVFGTRETAIALDFYLQLTLEKWVSKAGQTLRGYAVTDPKLGYAMWDRGQVAMSLVYFDEQFISGLNPDLIGLAPVPMGPTGVRAAELNSRMMGLFSQIKHPAVRDAAWEYILYEGSEAAKALRTKILVEGGMGRFVNPNDLRNFGYPEIARFTPKGWSEVFRVAAETGKPEPYGKNSNLAYRMLARPINQAIQLSLQDALPEDRDARLSLLEGILKNAEADANALMIGTVSANERTTRTVVAAVFLLVAGLAFALVIFRVFRTFSEMAQPSARGQTRSRTLLIAGLLAPTLLSIALWKYYPLAAGSLMGFQDYKILGDSTWVGLKHFGDMLWDAFWWRSLWNSMRFSFLALVFGFLPSIVLAILLHEVPRGKLVYRLLFYLPAVLAGLVTVLLWKQFYDPLPQGALNSLVLRIPSAGFVALGLLVLWAASALARRFWFHEQRYSAVAAMVIGTVFFISIGSIAWPVLREHGLDGAFRALPEPVQWLRDPRYSMISCIVPSIWAGMGPGCLIYLAALKGIPDDYYDAAEVDGATFLDKLIAVVIPRLRPLIIINFVGAFIGSWMGSADTILAMTGGQAGTEVAPLNIFYKAFVYLEFGPATAMAWMLGFILIGFTVYQLRVLSKVEFRTTGQR